MHRWKSNEDASVRTFGAQDRCLTCGVSRYNPMSGSRAVARNAIAAGPCPSKPLRELTEAEIDQAVARYTGEPTP